MSWYGIYGDRFQQIVPLMAERWYQLCQVHISAGMGTKYVGINVDKRGISMKVPKGNTVPDVPYIWEMKDNLGITRVLDRNPNPPTKVDMEILDSYIPRILNEVGETEPSIRLTFYHDQKQKTVDIRFQGEGAFIKVELVVVDPIPSNRVRGVLKGLEIFGRPDENRIDIRTLVWHE